MIASTAESKKAAQHGTHYTVLTTGFRSALEPTIHKEESNEGGVKLSKSYERPFVLRLAGGLTPRCTTFRPHYNFSRVILSTLH